MKIVINDTDEQFKDLEYIFSEMDRLGIKYSVECDQKNSEVELECQQP